MALPPHLRKLTAELNKHSTVHEAKLSLHEISVRYKNGLQERWVTNSDRYKRDCCWIYDLPDDHGNPTDLPIGKEFESNPLDDDHEEKQKYFALRSSEYLTSTFASRRIAVHRLIDRLIKEGWVDIKYSHNTLIRDFIKFRADNVSRFDRGYVDVHGYGARTYHGLKILEHFVPWGNFGDEKSMVQAWKRPFNLYSAICHLIKIKHDITRSAIAKVLRVSAYGGGIRMYAPTLYKAIFSRFGIDGVTIADPNPGIGSKAMAAVSRQCDYYYGEGPFSESADEISKFVGVGFSRIEERDKFDVVLIDSNWNTDIFKLLADIERWRERADMLLLYVPDDCYGKIKSSFLPIETCRINAEFIYHDSPDWMILI